MSCSAMLCDANLGLLLAHLNAMTVHRFTGIYQFRPAWVVSIVLFDRDNPELSVGADVTMKESYCWLTGMSGGGYVIEDACADARLLGHAARAEVRSYVAVVLRDRQAAPWGTLCHFDFAPRVPAPNVLAELEAYRTACAGIDDSGLNRDGDHRPDT